MGAGYRNIFWAEISAAGNSGSIIAYFRGKSKESMVYGFSVMCLHHSGQKSKNGLQFLSVSCILWGDTERRKYRRNHI